MFQRLTIIGVGLLGASVAQAAKRNIPGILITVWARKPATRTKCAQQPWCDIVAATLEEAVKNADLVVIGAPVDVIPELVEQATSSLAPGAVVTDVGSTKGWICKRCTAVMPKGTTFIGSHPMAGSEKTGMGHARETLFEKSACFVTPMPSSAPETVEHVAHFWTQLGARVFVVTPEEHDRITAHISHFPHMLASCLCRYLATQCTEWKTFVGNGLRDTTRIAAGDPTLWESIFSSNRSELLKVVKGFQQELARFEGALRKGDAEQMHKLLQEAKGYRDAITPRKRK